MAAVISNINQPRAMRVAVRRIEGFAKQFGEAHRNLARHAAFPFVLTPDLLYQIWANFVPEAPWTAVAHVLLSRLCRQVGYEMYEMDIADRNLLLRELKEQFGQERLDELGEFLLDYVTQRLTEDDPDTLDLAQAQEWTALAYTKPIEVARELAEVIVSRVEREDTAEVFRLTSLVETLAEPLVEAGFEPLLIYIRGIGSFIRGDQGMAAAEFNKVAEREHQVQIAGVSLPIPQEILDSRNLDKSSSRRDTSGGFILHTRISDAEILNASLRDLGITVKTNAEVRGYSDQQICADVVAVLEGDYDLGFCRSEDGTFDLLINLWGVAEKYNQTELINSIFGRYRTTWLQAYPEDSEAVKNYLVQKVETDETPVQKQEAIWLIFAWLHEHPEDSEFRQQHLVLVEKHGTPVQKQTAIVQTAAWLQTHPENLEVRQQYLALVEKQETLEYHLREVIAQTVAWLKVHPEASEIQLRYLALLRKQEKLKQKQEEATSMSNQLQDEQQTQPTKSPLDLSGAREIRILGDRGAGKTTYMATLACLPNLAANSPIQAVEPFDQETDELINTAKSLLKRGQTLSPTLPHGNAYDLPNYSILITLKPRFLSNPIAAITRRNIRFLVSCREYPGELVEDLHQNFKANPSLSNYLDECISVSNLLLLIDGGRFRNDQKYAQAFANLEKELKSRLTAQEISLSSYRIAVVFSKFEQAETWIYRNNLEKLMSVRFPRTQTTLHQWSKGWGCSLAYFACSAFGMMDNPPRPNVRVIGTDERGTTSILAKPNLWNPFGLVAPIYWLHTGKHDPRLRDI